MGKVVIGMSMSLDGYINDRTGSVAALYPDFETLASTESLRDSMLTTGAVVMGKRTFAMGNPDSYADSYEYQVPIFVVTHHPPAKHPRETDRLKFSFVQTGLESAIAQAKAAAGEKDVTVVGGATVFQDCLRLKLADEMHIDILPVLLGAGLRLFDSFEEAPILLDKIKVLETPVRTSLQFRVRK